MKKAPYAFTQDFVKALFRGIISDAQLSTRVCKYLDPNRFEEPTHKLLAELLVNYQKKFRQLPTEVVVGQLLEAKIHSGGITREDAEAVRGVLLASSKLVHKVEADFIRDQVIAEERRSAVWAALDSSLKRYVTAGGDYMPILEDIQRAVHLGLESKAVPGEDYLQTLSKRLQQRLSGFRVKRYATGIGPLDPLIDGGLAAGELGCVLGGPKMGKSQFLGAVSLQAMLEGLTVHYYSMEMSVDAVMERMDAAIARTPIVDLVRQAKHVNSQVYEFAGTGGELWARYFSPSITTVEELEEDLKEQTGIRGTKPDLVVVDYGDLLTSSRKGGADKRHEELGAVYTDLRKMAQDWALPVWTASQTRREALEKSVPTIADVGESLKKVQIADLIVALCGTEEERQNKIVRIYVAACRYFTGGTITGPMKTAFDQGRMWDDLDVGGF